MNEFFSFVYYYQIDLLDKTIVYQLTQTEYCVTCKPRIQKAMQFVHFAMHNHACTLQKNCKLYSLILFPHDIQCCGLRIENNSLLSFYTAFLLLFTAKRSQYRLTVFCIVILNNKGISMTKLRCRQRYGLSISLNKVLESILY